MVSLPVSDLPVARWVLGIHRNSRQTHGTSNAIALPVDPDPILVVEFTRFHLFAVLTAMEIAFVEDPSSILFARPSHKLISMFQ